MGCLGVGAADAELFDLETPVAFDHGVEDALHQMGVNEVALGFDNFLMHGYFPG
jgi:hypothetical protein